MRVSDFIRHRRLIIDYISRQTFTESFINLDDSRLIHYHLSLQFCTHDFKRYSPLCYQPRFPKSLTSPSAISRAITAITSSDAPAPNYDD
jgi:hypothetical protein